MFTHAVFGLVLGALTGPGMPGPYSSESDREEACSHFVNGV
jgi:hypothetical protein